MRLACSSLFLLLFSIFPFSHLLAQSQWAHIFNTVHLAGSYSYTEGIQTSDGGFLVGGGNGNAYGAANAFLLKFDDTGSIQWYLEYPGFHSFNAVAETADGGFIAGGRVNGDYPYRNSLLKTDVNGNVTWSRNINNTGQGGIAGLVEVPGGYICAFTTTFRVNSAGDSLLWNRIHIGGGGTATDIKPATGGYIVTGLGSFGNPAGNYNGAITKLDTAGTVLWNHAFGGNEYDWNAEGEETNDGGYAGAGWTRSFANPLNECYLSRFDAVGGLLWTRTYGDPVESTLAWAMRETSSGGFVLAGAYGQDILLMATDANGSLQWAKTYGPGVAYSLEIASDGGFFVVGKENDNDLVVIKTDSLGNSFCDQNVSLMENNRLFTIGPNALNSTLSGTDSARVVSQNAEAPIPSPCSPPLAVQSVGLEAERSSRSRVDLRWWMEGAGQVKTWTVQKSADGAQWKELAELDSRAEMAFVDERATAATAFYRILLTEENGSRVYSEAVTVLNAEAASQLLSAHPNPIATGETLRVLMEMAETAEVRISLATAEGRVLLREREVLGQGTGGVEMALRGLAPGIYLLNVAVDDRIYRKKLVVVR